MPCSQFLFWSVSETKLWLLFIFIWMIHLINESSVKKVLTLNLKKQCFGTKHLIWKCYIGIYSHKILHILYRSCKDQFSCPTQAIGGQCPSSLAEHYAEVLFSVSRNCPSVLSLWLREALLPPGFPSSHLTAENKEHFCQQILR